MSARTATVKVRPHSTEPKHWTWERSAANGTTVAMSAKVYTERSNAVRAARAEAKLTGARYVDTSSTAST